MGASTQTLRSYAQLLAQVTGAEGVVLYLPAASEDEPAALVHHGELPPPPELTDLAAAADLDRSLAAPSSLPGPGLVDVQHSSSAAPDCILLRVLWGSKLSPPGNPPPGRPRRKSDLKHQPRAGGALWVGLRRAPQPPADEASHHRLVGALMALGHRLSQTRERRSQPVDPVTALPSRPELIAELDAALAASREHGRAFGLLLVNPDDFGAVNERFDRRVGDAVLREVAGRLAASVRRGDYVARYGGAIFAVVLRGPGNEDTQRLASDLLRRLTEDSYHQGALRLGFSVGLAFADSRQNAGMDWQEIIEHADQALSTAKRDGGSCVRTWLRGSEVERAAHLDRLHAVFTGKIAKDYRHMMLLWESISLVVAATDSRDLGQRIARCLAQTFRAQRVGVFQLAADGHPVLLGGVASTRGGGAAFVADAGELAIAARACREPQPILERADPVATGAARRAIWAVPMAIAGHCLGAVLLEGRGDSMDLDSSDLRFLSAFAAQMAMALDRARLAEQEHRREHEARQTLESQVEDLREALRGSRLVYCSAAMQTLVSAVHKVAPTDATVLITGESGTGKEVVARTLHALSSRRHRPLVVVDCSAISPTLIESELFGHERGAFTGAHARTPGRIPEARGGTLFLDEFAELPLDVQGKLLRFVQDKEFTPVGSSRPRTVDVRILAATNVDLRARLAAGRFREDLFYRLNVVRLHVPALRERPDDVLLLARLFVKQAAALHGKPNLTLTAGAEAALLAYSWPGNVRELQNRMTQAVLFSEGAEVDAPDLWGLPRSADRPESAATMATAESAPAAASDEQAGEQAGRRLRSALAAEIDAALRVGRPPPPVGRWLVQDLVLIADRLASGVGRRAAQALGIAETTYRRRRRRAERPRSASEGARPASWNEVTSALADLVRERGGEADLGHWVEACLLDEILSRVPADVRAAAALLGVSQPTLARRVVGHGLPRSWIAAQETATAAPLAKQRRADLLGSTVPRSTLQRKH